MAHVRGIDNENKFKIILKTTLSLSRDCGGGYDIIRVKEDGVECLKQ